MSLLLSGDAGPGLLRMTCLARVRTWCSEESAWRIQGLHLENLEWNQKTLGNPAQEPSTSQGAATQKVVLGTSALRHGAN